MQLFIDLFTTDYGLMSLIGIVFMLGMGVFFFRLFTNQMNASATASAHAVGDAHHERGSTRTS
jgi:putative copper export protein